MAARTAADATSYRQRLPLFTFPACRYLPPTPGVDSFRAAGRATLICMRPNKQSAMMLAQVVQASGPTLGDTTRRRRPRLAGRRSRRHVFTCRSYRESGGSDDDGGLQSGEQGRFYRYDIVSSPVMALTRRTRPYSYKRLVYIGGRIIILGCPSSVHRKRLFSQRQT